MFWSFIFNKRFIIRAEDFGQQEHAQLREKNARQAKPECPNVEGPSEVGRDACAECISQRSEEKMEGAGEFEQFTISDW